MTPDAENTLREIRDLLRSREEKYDNYLKQAAESHRKQLEASKTAFVWWIIAITIGVYVGGIMLHLTVAR